MSKTDADKSRTSPAQAALSMATGHHRANHPADADKEAARHAADVSELEHEIVRARENILRLESAAPSDKPEQRREAILKAKTRLAAIEKRLAELKGTEPSSN